MAGKELILHEAHQSLGAKMVEFAGWQMPISYSGIQPEHLAVRQAAGLFDVSHMGEFIVKGRQALDLVQKVTSNDASRLAIGDVQYSCLPNEDGGIIDDLLVYRLGEDRCSEGEQAFMLVVNASNIDKDLNWIRQFNSFDATIENISDQCGLLALQGPNAKKVLQPLTSTVLDEIDYYHFKKGEVAGLDNVIISATGYTGAGGFELYVRNDQLPSLWSAIMTQGETEGLLAAGLGARDTLRLEMGYCLYGNDIDDTTNPFDAGLGWITKMKKGNFIGSPALQKIKEEKQTQALVGFIAEGRRVPRQGYEIQDRHGNQIGRVTSGTASPSLNQNIGMGYVSTEHRAVGSPITILAGTKTIPAQVTKLPFLHQS